MADANKNEDLSTNEVDDVQLFNPEPPLHLLEKAIELAGDNIGSTVFSQRWVIQTLMKIVNAVEEENKSNVTEEGTGNEIIELDEELETTVCKLWDMTMNEEVADFLLKLPTVNILLDTVSSSKSPRLMEISIGILANIACHSEICNKLAENLRLRQISISLLQCSDPLCLAELMRLLHACCSCKSHSSWLEAFRQESHVLQLLTFILESSTNVILLKNLGILLDSIMDCDDELCSSWSTSSFLNALLEAIKQLGFKERVTVEPFLHILHLFSTSEQGLQSLVSCTKSVIVVCGAYLNSICQDDCVSVFQQETTLAAILTLLSSLILKEELSLFSVLKNEKVVHHTALICCSIQDDNWQKEKENNIVNSNKCAETSIEESSEDHNSVRKLLHEAIDTFFCDLSATSEGIHLASDTIDNLQEPQCRILVKFFEQQNQHSFLETVKMTAEETKKYNKVLSVLNEFVQPDSATGDT